MTLAQLSATASRAVRHHMRSSTTVLSDSNAAALSPAPPTGARVTLASISCARAREHVGVLRRAGTAVLQQQGLGELADAAALLISELVTNAVLHGQGDNVALSLSLVDGALLLQVEDGSRSRPRVTRPGAEGESGRGMFLVACVSDEWGTSRDGMVTWCTLPLADGAAA